jgi:hypothetical protein
LAGLVVQPVTGVLDGVSKLTEGVSNNLVIEKEHNSALDKSRYPRIFYGPQKIFKAYDERDAKLYRTLGTIKKHYQNLDVMDAIYFSFHYNKSSTLACLWLTLEKIFFFINTNKQFELLTKISMKIVEDIGTDSNAVKIMLKKKKSYLNVKFFYLIILKDNILNINIKDVDTKGKIYVRLVILRDLYLDRVKSSY